MQNQYFLPKIFNDENIWFSTHFRLKFRLRFIPRSKFNVKTRFFQAVNSRILGSIVVSIPACHAGDPGSIPGRGGILPCLSFIKIATEEYQSGKDLVPKERLELLQHRWFSGRILACHAGGPGSIPGRCTFRFPELKIFRWPLIKIKNSMDPSSIADWQYLHSLSHFKCLDKRYAELGKSCWLVW